MVHSSLCRSFWRGVIIKRKTLNMDPSLEAGSGDWGLNRVLGLGLKVQGLGTRVKVQGLGNNRQ